MKSVKKMVGLKRTPVWIVILKKPTNKAYNYFHNNSHSYDIDSRKVNIVCNVNPYVVGQVSNILSRDNGLMRLSTVIDTELKS